MSKQRNAITAGLFILVSIAGMVGIIIGIKGLSHYVDPSDIRYISFKLADDVGGLAIGDAVRIGGFKVGEVRAIELVGPHDARLVGGIIAVPEASLATRPARVIVKASGEMLLISISMPRKYELRDGARVSIQSTVTGQSNLNFDTLGSGSILPANAVLAGRPGTISELLASLQEMKPKVMGIVAQLNDQSVPAATDILQKVRYSVVPRVNETLDAYRETAQTATATVEKVKGHVDPALAKYHKMGDSATSMMDEIRSLFGDIKADFRTTIANLSAATGSVKEKLPGILDKTDSAMAHVNHVVLQTSEALEDIKQSAANIKDATGNAKMIVAGNHGRIDTMLESLKATGINLERASADIRHSPWRLLYQPKEAELANINLFDTAREFAVGATNLNDAAQALRAAVKEGHPDDAVIKELTQRLEERFKRFHEVEDKLWKEVKN